MFALVFTIVLMGKGPITWNKATVVLPGLYFLYFQYSQNGDIDTDLKIPSKILHRNMLNRGGKKDGLRRWL